MPAVERWHEPITSAPWRFRNKAKFAVGGTAEHALLGIQAMHSATPGQVTDLTACPLHEEPIERALPAIKAFIARARLVPYDVAARTGELKFVLITASPAGELMVRFVLRSSEALPRLRKHLPALLASIPGLAVVSANLQALPAAVLEGPEEIPLHGDTLTMAVNGLGLHLRPRSFFQTNTAVAEALYRQATDWLVEAAPSALWDLYCGVGGFALHAARAMPGLAVRGIEVSAEAIESARMSAGEHGLDGAAFVAGDAHQVLASDPDSAPEAVVVNPPRRGIGVELARWLERSSARTLVYSSCNAATLARDLEAMPGWRVEQAQLLDMFPHTTHYEVLTLLRRP